MKKPIFRSLIWFWAPVFSLVAACSLAMYVALSALRMLDSSFPFQPYSIIVLSVAFAFPVGYLSGYVLSPVVNWIKDYADGRIDPLDERIRRGFGKSNPLLWLFECASKRARKRLRFRFELGSLRCGGKKYRIRLDPWWDSEGGLWIWIKLGRGFWLASESEVRASLTTAHDFLISTLSYRFPAPVHVKREVFGLRRYGYFSIPLSEDPVEAMRSIWAILSRKEVEHGFDLCKLEEVLAWETT